MRTILVRLCYDGTRYKGWQRLKGEENTLQGKLETALSRILEEPIEVSGSGRTDAGAHALGQVASFHCENPMDCGEISARLRRYLPEDMGIYSCEEAAPRFHARLNAKEKTYCYRVWNGPEPCVFERRYVYRLEESLDMAAMEAACGETASSTTWCGSWWAPCWRWAWESAAPGRSLPFWRENAGRRRDIRYRPRACA